MAKKSELDKVVIWGARMSGLGAFRKINGKTYDVISFVDSDPAMWGVEIMGRKVVPPHELPGLFGSGACHGIVIAAILKAQEIRALCDRLFSPSPSPNIMEFGFKDSPSYTIDIMGACNLKCISCPHSQTNADVPKGSMPLSKFSDVLEKATKETPGLSHISLYSWGDPLIHPHLPQMIDLVHQKGIAVAVSSNLSMNLDDKLEAIVKSSPDYLKVSVSGFSQEIYATTHQGGDIRLVKSNLYKLRYLMDRFKKHFLVDINYHLYKNNSTHELEKFKLLALELGFVLSETYSLVMPLERVISYLDGSFTEDTRHLNENLLLVDIDEGIEAAGGRLLGDRDCPFRTNQININSDCSVPVCCLTYSRLEDTVVTNDYLKTPLPELNALKSSVKYCERCQREGLPEYNLGYNSQRWAEIAKSKIG